MGLIIYEDKKIVAKGSNPNNTINENKLKSYFHAEDYSHLDLLKNIPKITLSSKENLTLFYPGCGIDILFPLVYLETLFPEIKKIHFIFVDNDNTLGIIKTILDDVGISFCEIKEKISFYWKKMLVELNFINKNIEDELSQINCFDIYFERAFRIIKEQIPNYEERVVDKLNSGGILISDSGFQEQKLKKIAVPKILSSYQEMIIGVKE